MAGEKDRVRGPGDTVYAGIIVCPGCGNPRLVVRLLEAGAAPGTKPVDPPLLEICLKRPEFVLLAASLEVSIAAYDVNSLAGLGLPVHDEIQACQDDMCRRNPGLVAKSAAFIAARHGGRQLN